MAGEQLVKPDPDASPASAAEVVRGERADHRSIPTPWSSMTIDSFLDFWRGSAGAHLFPVDRTRTAPGQHQDRTRTHNLA